MEAFKHFKIIKAPRPSEGNAEMILASCDVGIRVLIEPCQRILDGKGMPAYWATSDKIPIFKGKGDIMNCGMYRGAKLVEQAMKIVEKYLRKVAMIVDMQFDFMPGKDTIDAVFILRRIHEQYLAKQKKLYMCFVDLEKNI